MNPSRMPVGPALQVLVDLRRDQVVITNQGSAREWPKLTSHRRDFHFIPSAMGEAVPLGLGIALAQSETEVWVLTGDGSLLMNLGCLVTVIDSRATNLTVVILDNGIYEVTGGQRTAASAHDTDFAGIARAAGFPNVSRFDDLADWRARAGELMASPGPRFIQLRVEPVRDDYILDPPCPIVEQVARLRAACRE